jgi:hypothetical protein
LPDLRERDRSRSTANRPQGSRANSTAAVIVAVGFSEILGVAGHSIVPALLPQFLDDWS